MSFNTYFDLNDGLKIPAIGYGTWLSDDEEQLEKAIDAALEVGYRHIDGAYVYQNENVIGRVLQKWFSSGKLKREDIFLTTKLPPSGMRPEHVQKFIKESLAALQVDYVDLYLVHVPFGLKYVEGTLYPTSDDGKSDYDANTDHVAIWKAMEELVSLGLTKSIGVSNFNKDQIQRILDNSEIPPCNLQVEHHAYLQQKDLVRFCKENKIVVTAYSPLGSPGLSKLGRETPDLMGHPVVNEIAKKYNKSAAQVLLKHIIQTGIVAIPKSTNPERLRQNIDIFDFSLSDEDLQTMNDLDQNLRILDFKFLFKGIENHPEYPFKELV
ncbi:1,5-anhydro-D-fructose reductase-like [Anoplophora glabripennis]|uniref:1,5-anhydro-D-fructose reductase-like n=1 Tax=Anoplophora glabripennis TaxID=217634 RepID=UPI000873B572|nr:1,5-anhydro-D-fructose reductase-like [Anoplophora glabripennis]